MFVTGRPYATVTHELRDSPFIGACPEPKPCEVATQLKVDTAPWSRRSIPTDPRMKPLRILVEDGDLAEALNEVLLYRRQEVEGERGSTAGKHVWLQG